MSTRYYIHTVVLLLLWVLPVAGKTLVYVADNDSSFYDNYPFIRFVEEGSQPSLLTDEEFYNTSAKVIFPVNKYVLPKNDSLLSLLERLVFPRINQDSLRLRSLSFRGAASPEGPLRWNTFLGQHRMQALYDFVSKHIDTADDSLTISKAIDVEDYRTLCIMMEHAGDADYGLVKAIVDVYLEKDDLVTLKKRLREVHNGKLWQRLLRTYYPVLRSARFVLFIEKNPLFSHLKALPYYRTEVVAEVKELPPLNIPSLLPRREFLSVKSNLLFDLAYMPGYNRWCPIPNVAVEYYPLSGHFTYGASFDCPWWQHYWKHKYFQIRNYQLETRYYLKPNGPYKADKTGKPSRPYDPKKPAFAGFFLMAYAHAVLYGIAFSADRGWMGEGAGAGIGAGYVMPLSRNGHWRLELAAQAGFFTTKYDPFQYENPVNPLYRDHLYYYKWTLKSNLFKKRQYRFNWIGPTRVAVTLSYDLLYRRIQKKGVSLQSWEIYEPYKALEAQQERRTAE